MKKLVSLLTTLTLFVSMIPTSIFAVKETEYENQQQNLFTYTFTGPENADENGTAIITGFVENYQELLGSSTEITLPDIYVNSETNVNYNCKTDITKSKFMRNNNYITSIIFPSSYDNITSSFLLDCTAMKKIIFRHSGTFKFNLKALSGCTSLEKIYVYSNDLANTPSASIFTNVPTTAIAYVKNETVKEKMANWPGSVIVDANMGSGGSTVIKTSLAERITEVETFLLEIDKTQYNNIDALETELANAKAVYENNAATQEEVDSALSKLTGKLSNATKKTDKSALATKIAEVEEFLSGITSIEEKRYVNLPGLRQALAHAKSVNQNASATQTEVDNEVKALTSARNDVQRKPDIQAGELIRYTREYEDYIKNVQEDDFTDSSWYKVKDIYNNSVKMYRQEYPYQLATQEEVDAMTEKMRNFKTLLEKADTSEQKSNLNNLIAQAVEIRRDNYNQESLEALDKAVSDVQAINDGLKSKYNNAAENIKNAITNLVDKNTETAGDLFAKVQKGGKATNIFKGKADDKMTAAERIRITFDCASDVSYNNGATIEVKAVCGETESYKQFKGTDDTYTKGSKGWTVDLPLSSAIKSGEEISIEVFTYSWEDAASYVYGITKVELLDNQNILCKTITDRTILMDKLKTEIEKAEKIEQGSYSDESFAELTKAIESAKALEEKASKADIDKAIDALDKAVKGLKEPTPTEPITPPTKQEPSNNSQPTKPSIAQTNKSTRSSEAVAKDKKAAQKLMKQAKITKLTAKSKAKKKITVSWKKVKKAKGYQVEVSAKKNFQKPIFKKFTAKTKLNIKNKKIKSKKTYYIRVRAYATYKDKNNVTKKVYSKWIKKIRKVKVK